MVENHSSIRVPERLSRVLCAQDCGGVIRSKHQLNDALGHMVASLDDRWSEWLPPSQFRRCNDVDAHGVVQLLNTLVLHHG